MKLAIFLLAVCGNLLASDLQPPPPLSFIRGKGEHYIGLKGFNDKWVVAEMGGGTHLACDRGQLNAWETFRLFCHTDNCSEVSLQAMNNQWVGAAGNGQITVNSSSIGPSERFTLETHPHHLYAFKTAHGSYVTVNAQSRLMMLKAAPFSNVALFKIKTLSKGFHFRDEL
jgi:hypothetical protein